jgi:hypothetical protein
VEVLLRRKRICVTVQKLEPRMYAECGYPHRCKAEDFEPFCKFIENIATVDWCNTDPTDVQ